MVYFVYFKELEKEMYILGGGLAVFGVIQFVTYLLTKQNKTENGFVEIMTDTINMPKTMGQMAVVQFFSWFALFAMWIYTTAAVTGHVYGTSDTTSELYNEGANWVGVLFGIYNGFRSGGCIWFARFGKILQSENNTFHISDYWRTGLNIILFYNQSKSSLGFHGGSRCCLGKYFVDALCHPHRFVTGKKDGSLYGNLQFFYCDSSNSGCKYFRFYDAQVFRWRCNLGAGGRRYLHDNCRGNCNFC
jgi:hypothetical protein